MITYKVTGIESIDIIKPLVAKLSDYHKDISSYFSKDFEVDNYDQKKSFISEKQNVQLTIAHDEDEPIAYLVASVHGNEGTIESLYVDDNYRGYAIGDTLMSLSLDWIKKHEPECIKISVAYGNQVLSFYEKFGFYPRSIILKDIN
jgi:ribosomal protein S18 acetylase RimI-like enzyme